MNEEGDDVDNGRRQLLRQDQRAAALRSALEGLRERLFLVNDDNAVIVAAASATEHGTETLLVAIQALEDAVEEVLGAAEEESSIGPVVDVDVDTDAASVPEDEGGGDHVDEDEDGGVENANDDNNDDDNTDDEIYLDAVPFDMAVHVLRDVNDRRPIRALMVWDDVEDFDFDEIEYDARPFFQEFVTLLGQSERGRVVRLISITTNWSRMPDNGMERLFRNVLPGYPALEDIQISIEDLPARYLRMLTEAVPTEAGAWPLSRLEFRGYGFKKDDFFDDNLQAILEMVNRNVAVDNLSLDLTMEAEQCKLVCQALPRATNMRQLFLSLHEVVADTLDGFAVSSLRGLSIRGSFTEAGLQSLSRQLRTNTMLERIWLSNVGDNTHVDPHALHELVKTYNYTIRTMEGNLGSGHRDARVTEQLETLMRRNEWIRNVLQHLQDPSHTVPPAVLAIVLGSVSALPTLLQRFVKHFYVSIVTERLAGGARGGTTTGRRRGRRRPRLEFD